MSDMNNINIAVVGLGLIGGSLAKAFKTGGNCCIYGYDKDKSVWQYAQMTGVIDNVLSPENIAQCDYIFIALYPAATLEFLETNAAGIKKGTVVIDCCGVKSAVCPTGFMLAEKHGFSFVGGHPMAGIQYSGLKYSRANLFNNACMILVPKSGEDIARLERIKNLLKTAGFSHITITTAEKHDEIIAFTSQLAHVVSNAYVKSPSATAHKGFSAGSYRDLTRVARLNEGMWAELFIENAPNLSKEIEILIAELEKYKKAVESKDFEQLKNLLREGREIKERIEGHA